MSKGYAPPRIRGIQLATYLSIGAVLAIPSIFIPYMVCWIHGKSIYVGTSLISALIGFTLLSAALYVLRLSAYVYAIEKGEFHGK